MYFTVARPDNWVIGRQEVMIEFGNSLHNELRGTWRWSLWASIEIDLEPGPKIPLETLRLSHRSSFISMVLTL